VPLHPGFDRRPLLQVIGRGPTATKWSRHCLRSIVAPSVQRLAADITGVAGQPRRPAAWAVELPGPGQATGEKPLADGPGRPRVHSWPACGLFSARWPDLGFSFFLLLFKLQKMNSNF
jgi:hypothetical protein